MVAPMIAYLRRHHVALIALFVALGGTSYAAIQLPANSVGTRQLRGGAVTNAKLSHSLRKLLARTSPKGTSGVPGAAGATGPAGPTGPSGGGSSARAYGYQYWQPCHGTGCASVRPVHYAVNATFDAPGSGAPAGTTCLTPGAGIDPSGAVLVVSGFAGQAFAPSGQVGVAHAEWVRGAPDCPGGDLEAQTSVITADSSGLHVTPETDLPFSFVIP